MIKKYKGGYTIIETMIFIMITGMMFTMAVMVVSGRQKEIQFSQGLRDVESKIKDYINDVSTGFFPSSTGLNCTLSSTTASTSPTLTSSGGQGQGTSNDCIFVGKVLQFSPNISGTVNDDKLMVHTLAGRKRNASGGFVTDLDQSNVVMVTPTSSNTGIPELTEVYELKWGLKVTKVSQTSGATYGSVGIVSSFGQTSGSGFVSGAQTINSGAVDSTSLGQDKDSAAASVNGMTGLVRPATGIVICLANSDDSRKASITIGSEGRDANIKLKIDDYEATICG